jgi:hypothetical protein
MYPMWQERQGAAGTATAKSRHSRPDWSSKFWEKRSFKVPRRDLSIARTGRRGPDMWSRGTQNRGAARQKVMTLCLVDDHQESLSLQKFNQKARGWLWRGLISARKKPAAQCPTRTRADVRGRGICNWEILLLKHRGATLSRRRWENVVL